MLFKCCVRSLSSTVRVEDSTTDVSAVAATEPATAPAADHPKRRRFERYTPEDGEIVFVDVDTEESVWDLPSDGEEVEAPC